MINALNDAAVEIYYGGAKKFETASGGVTITGVMASTTMTGTVATATQNSITTATGLVSVGALNSGTIATGFGAIDNGTSNLTSGGLVSIDADADADDTSADSSAGRLTLGASGDLSPLAHLALPLIGLGEVKFKGERISGQEISERFGWKKINLQSKEGLALLNGTQFMSAYGIYNLLKAHKLSYLADLIGTISLEAFDGRIEPFNELVHLVRPHNGQIKTAERICSFLEGSELMLQPKKHVQDPYSFRCMPQVHGATKDTLSFVKNTFVTEINAVTDNPNIFINEDKIISGGNFHGQPLAFGFDFLKIAMAEIGNISERRTYQLVSGLRDLPSFLVD
jgi:hypothetical protein